MGYIQSLILGGVLTSSMFFMLAPLTDVIDNSLDAAIQLTASQVEDIAQLHHYSVDNSIKYSQFDYPSVRDGGIDKIVKSIGYTNYYDPHLNARVFLFNNTDTNDCYFTYNDQLGTTFVEGQCGITNEMKDKLKVSFEVEHDL